MKRFFFISLFLHGALLSLLFSWEVPPAYRFLPGYILEVSLVERIEGDKSKRPGPFGSNRPREENLHKKKDDGETRRVAQVKEDLKIDESKPEKAEPVQKEIGEERAKTEEKMPAELPVPKTIVEEIPVLMARLTPPAGGGGEGGAVFLPSAEPGTGQQGMAIGGGVKGSGTGGEGGTSRFSSSRGASEDGDSVTAEIVRRIEKAKLYPRMARKMGVEGRVIVRFKLKPSGKVESAEVLESSGSDILDEASLETIHRAAPLPYKEGWLKVVILFKIL